MTDKKGIIRALGTELEEIAKNPETSEVTKDLIAKAMQFGYTVRDCEANFDSRNDPYSSAKCIKLYERIKELLKGKS